MAFTLTENIVNLKIDEANPIGSGGEGSVFPAIDPQLKAELAVKRVPIESFHGRHDSFFDEAAKLYDSRHTHVVEVKYGCIDHKNKSVNLVMPLYQKGSLKGLIDSRNLTTREIVRYSLQFLSGLNHIHSKEMLHYDIKLENVLISDANTALISDFGLAQYMDKYGFAPQFGATPAFAPPEFFLAKKNSIQFDIYQSGLAMYRMCIGDELFKRQYEKAGTKYGVFDENNVKEAILKGNFPERSWYLPHIPSRLITTIRTAMNIDLGVRYSTALEMINNLSKVEELLDWKYQPQSKTHLRWTNNKEDRLFVNSQKESDGTWTITFRPKRKNAREQKKENISENDNFKTINSILKELDPKT